MNNVAIKKYIYFFLTILTTWIVIRLFFGSAFYSQANYCFFSTESEDLIKDIYTTTYHIKYDKDVLHCSAMGYPYSEYYTYTGMNPMIAFSLQALQKMGVENAWQFVIPLVNWSIIISIFLCSLFLFLLFEELKLPNLPSMVGAVAITFLMPQIQRMGGHLSLSYLFIIPLALYLSVLLYRTQKYIWAIFLGILLIFSGFLHPYYLLFLAGISFVFYLYLLIAHQKEQWKTSRVILFFCIQFLIPSLLFLFLSSIHDVPTDRPIFPGGMYDFRGRILGLFLPYGRLYFNPSNKIITPPNWESCCYVGIVALITSLVFIIRFFVLLCKRDFQKIVEPTGNTPLNLFIHTAFLLVLFATLFPIIIHNFPNLIDYIGPFAQFRALGRILWFPFLVLNILAVYWIWQWCLQLQHKWLQISILILVCIAYCFEIHEHAKLSIWPNEYAEWTDYDNHLPSNQWINQIEPSKYQAILSLPIFHVGSEQYYLPSTDKMLRNSALVSIKTGLPLICNSSSRYSISKSYECYELLWTPWKPYEILSKFPNNRPILIVSTNKHDLLNENERRILQYADSISSTDDFSLFSIEIENLRKLCIDYQQYINQLFTNNYSTSKENYYLRTWNDQPHKKLVSTINTETILYNESIDSSLSNRINLSFWTLPLTSDLYAQMKITVTATNNQGKQILIDNVPIAYYIYAINENNGLIQLAFELPEQTQNLCVTVGDSHFPTRTVAYDNLLIYPQDQHAAYKYRTKTNQIINILDNIPLY